MNEFLLLESVKVSNNAESAWSLTWEVCYWADRDCAARFCTLQPGVRSGILQARGQP